MENARGDASHIANISWPNGGPCQNAVVSVDLASGAILAVKDIAEAEGFVLDQNRPNPASGMTAFTYITPRDCEVHISLVDMTGKLIETLISGRVSEGAQGGPTWTDVASTNRPRWRRPRWSRSSSRRSRQPRRRIASISKASARSTAAVGSGGSSEARTARVGASRARASATPMRSSSCAVESTKPRAIVVGIRWRKAA